MYKNSVVRRTLSLAALGGPLLVVGTAHAFPPLDPAVLKVSIEQFNQVLPQMPLEIIGSDGRSAIEGKYTIGFAALERRTSFLARMDALPAELTLGQHFEYLMYYWDAPDARIALVRAAREHPLRLFSFFLAVGERIAPLPELLEGMVEMTVF